MSCDGRTSARSPSRTALPTWTGIDASSSQQRRRGSRSGSRERSRTASISDGSGRPLAASAIRCLARSSARLSMGVEATLSAGWTSPRSTMSFPSELIAQRAIDPRDDSRLLVYRLDQGRWSIAFSRAPQLLVDELVVVNDSRVVPGRLELRRSVRGSWWRYCSWKQYPTTAHGRASLRPSRRLRAGERTRAHRPRRAARGWALAGPCRWRAGRRGPLPPYVRERSRIPSGIRRCTPVRLGRRGADRRPPLHELLASLDLCASRCMSVSIPSGLSQPSGRGPLLLGERYSSPISAQVGRIAGCERALAVGTTTVRALESMVTCWESSPAAAPTSL